MKRISNLNLQLKWILLFLSFGTLAACSPEEPGGGNKNGKISSNVIYGSDGRLDLYQVSDERLKILADSSVALIKNADLAASGASVAIRGRNFGQEMNLCSTEKYREQDTAAFCSGSLVGPDLILTAGHCIENMADCQESSVVFGFALKAAGSQPQSVPAGEVYKCKEIIKTLRINTGADFAVIRVERQVQGHKVLAVRPTGDVEANASLVVIGHPVGLPEKITMGGTVRSFAAEHFVANLDTYGGNSGSPVFNLATGNIEGVLVRGEQDFENRGNCSVSKVCAEGSCRGEDVTKISVVRPYLSTSPVTPPSANPEKFSSAVRLAVPDNSAAGVSSSLAVSSAPAGRKVIVTVNVEHSYVGDLSLKILAPDGKISVLQNRAGGNARNLVKSFDVSSALSGVSAPGNYKLIVQDLAARDTGALVSWSLEFR